MNRSFWAEMGICFLIMVTCAMAGAATYVALGQLYEVQVASCRSRGWPCQ